MPDATFACPDLTTFCRRVLRTGSDLLTDRQRQRLTAVFATEQHVEVEATWGVYSASSPPTATTTEPQRRPN